MSRRVVCRWCRGKGTMFYSRGLLQGMSHRCTDCDGTGYQLVDDTGHRDSPIALEEIENEMQVEEGRA